MRCGGRQISSFLIIAFFTFIILILAGCTQSETPNNDQQPSPPSTPTASGAAPQELTGEWVPYSEAIFYDNGRHDWLDTPASSKFSLRDDGTWSFESSSGAWHVSPIEDSDWSRWGSESYGPTRKIVLDGWAGGGADGPIEESSRVDFIWAIYREGPPTISKPGTIQIKFGRQNP